MNFCKLYTVYINLLTLQLEEISVTLEQEPCSLTPSPLKEEVPLTRGSSPGLISQMPEPANERMPFDVTPCIVQLLEKDKEAEETSIVVTATT